MPQDLANYIIRYGYLTIFSLVFLQEIGVPNPVTNELVLLFSGYLAYTGRLDLTLVILTVVAADFIGTSLLYFLFYLFGEYLLKHAPKWLPMEKIENLKNKVRDRGRWGIFLGRLLPYVRGYTSVVAGLMEIPPTVFLTSVLLSAVLWSGGYAILGYALGSRWNSIISKLGFGQFALVAIIVILLIFYAGPWLHKKIKTALTRPSRWYGFC
jgi:membrane protein DedA with SNARE-associated domain